MFRKIIAPTSEYVVFGRCHRGRVAAIRVGGELLRTEEVEEGRCPHRVGEEDVEDVHIGLVREHAELVLLRQGDAGELADGVGDGGADVEGDGVADGVVVVGLAGLHVEETERREGG